MMKEGNQELEPCVMGVLGQKPSGFLESHFPCVLETCSYTFIFNIQYFHVRRSSTVILFILCCLSDVLIETLLLLCTRIVYCEYEMLNLITLKIE
jgi:hypothetical protein